MKTFVVAPVVLASLSNAFVIAPSQQQMQRHAPTTALNGLFDGVKDAFTAPALERSVLDAERETPIDRWMGWSVRPEEKEAAQAEFGTFDDGDGCDTRIRLDNVRHTHVITIIACLRTFTIIQPVISSIRWTRRITSVWHLPSLWELSLRRMMRISVVFSCNR